MSVLEKAGPSLTTRVAARSLRLTGLRREKLSILDDLRERLFFYRFLVVATTVSAALVAAGIVGILLGVVIFPDADLLLGFVVLGLGLGIVGWLVFTLTLRVGIEIQWRISQEVQKKAAEVAVSPGIDEELARRDRVENELSLRNLKDTFVLQVLSWNGLGFLEDGEYRFAARVNVLLGKNGYGKTMLFRTLATLIQRDREQARQLYSPDSAAASGLTLEVTRNGQAEAIRLESVYFRDSVGKIPLLAIPDARFVNRAVQVVADSITGSEPLSTSGAKSFLTQQPFENVVQELLAQFVGDYLTRSGGFDQPLFRLVEKVVRELTADDEFAFAQIARTGRSGYRILVRTQGNLTAPLPIQTASQGTLSIIAIFGLIYSFLHSLRPGAPDGEVFKTPGIVLIDEVDAHLHPSWQQKVLAMLTGTFPNVQFIVSAHSPLIVAGCDWGEVSVLRKPPGAKGFRVETLEEDFLGAKAEDLYRRVFEIEDIDRLYLQYSVKATMPPDEPGARERDRLKNKEKRTPEEEQRLTELLREERLIQRASDVRETRLNREGERARILKLERQVARLKAERAPKEARSAEGGGDAS